mgnify:CR=1 FL=1
MGLLDGKVALVTGGSRGIGKAIALKFASEGADVVFTYLSNKAAAEQTEQELGQLGHRVKAYASDASSFESAHELVKQVIEDFSRIDILVNNAGIAQQKMFCDITEQDFDRMMGVTVKGAFNCIQAALPDMVHEKSGKIINVSSMWGVCGASCEVHYSAAKSALIGLTKALARELAPSNIQVNCIAPGVIDTKMNASLGEETLELLKEESPMGRFGTPEEVAHLMLFLAGNGSDFITGQTIGIDGAFI